MSAVPRLNSTITSGSVHTQSLAAAAWSTDTEQIVIPVNCDPVSVPMGTFTVKLPVCSCNVKNS